MDTNPIQPYTNQSSTLSAIRTQLTRRGSIWFKTYLSVIVFSMAGWFASRRFGVDPGPIDEISGVFLIALGVVVVWIQLSCSAARKIAVIAGGAVVEYVGLKTGYPFGHYKYSDLWWPTVQLAGVGHYPILVPFAWFMMTGGAISVAKRTVSRSYAPFLAAIIVALVDLSMEPVMTKVFGYWSWEHPGPLFGVPIQNSLGWLAVGFAACAMLAPGESKRSTEPGLAIAAYCVFVAWVGFIAVNNWPSVLLVLIAILLLAANPIGSRGVDNTR